MRENYTYICIRKTKIKINKSHNYEKTIISNPWLYIDFM
jgi:hypothetical protein